MAIELTLIKVMAALVPATKADQEILDDSGAGPFKVTLSQSSDRSLKHHRLYWGGLISLVAEYWESDDGLISKYDRRVMGGLLEWVELQGKNTEALESLINLYLEDRADKIKAALPQHEKSGTRLHAVHNWLKEEAGYYDAVLTPTGVRKEIKSTKFNAMSQEEFGEFYRKAFNVAWNYVLSKHHFESQEEAERVAEQMAEMG